MQLELVAADRRKYERELLHARRRAEELVDTLAAREAELKQRAAFAEQLIGIVSHDLRNPLNAILLGTRLLSGPVDTAMRDSTVRRITNAALRATRLTSELLDFTKARLGGGLSVERREVDVNAVIAEAIEELRLAWPERELDYRHAGADKASADADRLAQVITNLVANAMSYGTKERPITVTSELDEAKLVVRVHNEGRPIPMEVRDRIFEPLQRGEEQVQRGSRSVGLGLYIVREIAHAHGGEALLESTADSGTTFAVVLPRAIG
ncbi:MAG: HAMP domain-containing sensor histidine kinase [Labilithrix sp.]